MPTTATPTRARANLTAALGAELDTPQVEWWAGNDGRTAHRADPSYPRTVIPATTMAGSGGLRTACALSATTYPAAPHLRRCPACLG